MDDLSDLPTPPGGSPVPRGGLSTGLRDLHGLGRLVIERKLASTDEVHRCLEIQASSAESGVFLKLGEIFVREGILTPTQVQTLLALQHVKIHICVRCFAQFNIEDWSPDRELTCPKCDGQLVEAQELKSLAVEDTVSDIPRDLEGRQDLAIIDTSVRYFANFEILGEISRGGMGVVYKARQRELERIVALKVLLGGGESTTESILRFQREARAVARLKHPNIVQIHEVGEHRGIHYFSMEYIPGVPLETMIAREDVEQRERLEMLARICDAVQAAHDAGVLHRDLKPSNILVTTQLEPYLIDFGIAQCATEHDVRLTRQGYIFGSPLYMAPEYVAGKIREFNRLCDVYALGVCLYQLIAGVTPFEDVETIQVLARILKEEARPVEEVVEGVPADIATICGRATERDPEQRYQTAAELGADIRRYLAGEPIMARPRPPLVRWWARRKSQVIAGLTMALVAGLAAVALYVPTRTMSAVAQAERDREEHRRAASRLRRELNRSRELMRQSAQTFFDSGQHERALALLDELIDQVPTDGELRLQRARVLQALGREQEAADELAVARRLGAAPEGAEGTPEGD